MGMGDKLKVAKEVMERRKDALRMLAEGPEFDSPLHTEWIVAVDVEGNVSILKSPNIHDSFFDAGMKAEYIGLPFEVDQPPGVYQWKCRLSESVDWESGLVDDYGFDVIEEQVLWE